MRAIHAPCSSLRSFARLAGLLSVFTAGCSNMSTHDLSSDLDRAAGKQASQVSYPSTQRVLSVSNTESISTVEYALSGTQHCRWQFDIDRTSNVVLRWRYPDSTAEKYCRSLAKTMP